MLIGNGDKIMLSKIKEIISQYLEINETRKSIIVITLIGLVIVGIYKAYLGNDIPPNISNLILGLSGIVFGANVSNVASNMYQSYVSSKSCNNGANVDNQIVNNNDINGSI